MQLALDFLESSTQIERRLFSSDLLTQRLSSISPFDMLKLMEAAWPHKANDARFLQGNRKDCAGFKILEIYATEDGSDPEVCSFVKTSYEVSEQSEKSEACVFRLFVITRSWRSAGPSHEKLSHFNIRQGDFTKILHHLGLTKFFGQTRTNVTGLFGCFLPQQRENNTPGKEYIGIIFDALLGLWATYDEERKQWQGVCIVPEASIDLKVIAKELMDLVHTKRFMYLFAAKYTMEFLGLRSGELPKQIEEIERHSGHHHSILRPLPAMYEKLEILCAKATATANLISYHKTVICNLAEKLLQDLEETSSDDENESMAVKQHIVYLKQQLNGLSSYFSYLERRAERQVSATFHLINQANASTNLVVARDTKILAMASKHDSSSMKILTAVTTTFLPGAFVATLFSMNMFNWFADDGTPVVSGRFWIYWSIALPLTVTTVGVWLGWEFRMQRKQKRQHQTLTHIDEEKK